MERPPLSADGLLEATDGDREEALRMLFVLARRCADDTDESVATGPELARVLGDLLQGEDRSDPEWTEARRMVTVVGPAGGPTPTAVNVVAAIDEVLNGVALELVPAEARYDDEDLLGIGGMGRVHRVRDRRLGRSVALKVLHGGVTGLASARRFALEAQLTAQLDHPNIVPLYDFGRDEDGGLYFTMKEVEGRSLADVVDDVRHELSEGGDPTTAILRLVRLFRQVCDGVAFAHDQGIAHRDLKPENVMVGDFGEVQVMDWGLAQRFGTRVPALAGTPHYMAPELVRDGEVEVGPGPDVYALGATLHHCLALEAPYAGRPGLVVEHLRQGPPDPPSARAAHPVPEELEAVARRAMARDPAQRYPSVSALAEDVQSWIDGKPLASLSYGPGALLAKWVRRNKRLVGGVAATAAVAAGLLVVGGVRYVRDVTEARDDARVAEREAVAAERVARTRLVDAQLAAARASTETLRYSRADALYRSAMADIEALDLPRIGVEVGRLDNHARAERPLFALPLQVDGVEHAIEAVNHWILRLEEGAPVRALEPPLFETRWTSAVALPPCDDRELRWETDTLALYCLGDGRVDRVDLGSGEREVVTELLGLPAELVAPDHTDLVFVGLGDLASWTREPMLSYRALRPTEGGGWEELDTLGINEVPSAWGPWFLGERYGHGHGTVLYHADRGAVRSLGLPLARGAIDRAGEQLATYHEGPYELVLASLLTGEERWRVKTDNPVAVRTFSEDGTRLYAGGTTPTAQEFSVEDGSVVGRYDGHDRSVVEVDATDALVLSRDLDGPILGHSRKRPADTLTTHAFGLLPAGDLLVAGDGQDLLFVDVATGAEVRRVPLPLADGETWSAESPQTDGALVTAEHTLVFVPLEGSPRVLLRSPEAEIQDADRLEDGHLAFCRGREVVVRTPDGIEHVLGSIEREYCRDVRLAGPARVFVSDFWAHEVHRFAVGHDGPVWSRELTKTMYRLTLGDDVVAVGGWDGRATVWDQQTGAERLGVRAIEGPALGSALSADGRFLAVGGWDHRVVVLDPEDGRALAEDTRHVAPVEWVAWSADGRLLVSADPDHVVLRDLDLPDRLEAGTAALSELALDPDRERSGAEWAAVARGLAVHGLWTDALSVADRAEGLSAVETGRWATLASSD